MKPEHLGLKLFEHVGEETATLFDQSFAEARKSAGAAASCFVGVKMHDNDFFAETSAWVTIYGRGRHRPEWDVTRKAALLSKARRSAVWKQYEAMVVHVAANARRVTPVNGPMILALIER